MSDAGDAPKPVEIEREWEAPRPGVYRAIEHDRESPVFKITKQEIQTLSWQTSDTTTSFSLASGFLTLAVGVVLDAWLISDVPEKNKGAIGVVVIVCLLASIAFFCKGRSVRDAKDAGFKTIEDESRRVC